jgi:prophage regulatory protein
MSSPEACSFLAKQHRFRKRNQNRIASDNGLRRKELNMTDKHLRRTAVEAVTGLSRSTIYELMARGEFPRPVKLTARAVAWPESKVAEWLAERSAG